MGLIVGRLGVDPLRPIRCLILFPEGSLGFQPVDEEMAGLECSLAMGRGGSHEDDAIARFEAPVAMDDEAVDQIPARSRLILDAPQLFLGHGGIVFQGHRPDRRLAGQIAHQTDEGADAADPVAAVAEPRHFGADVEILALHPDHVAPPPPRPPVIGGNKATSSPDATG